MTDFDGNTGDKLEWRRMLYKMYDTLIHLWSICELYGTVISQLICTICLKATTGAEVSIKAEPNCWVIMDYFSGLLTGDVIARRL